MRFVLLIAVSIAFLRLPVFAAEVEASGEEVSGNGKNEEKPLKTKLYNWDYKDLGTSAFDDLSGTAREPVGIVNSDQCPDGWLRFSNSCYYVEQELLGFAKAEKRCFEKKATLFVANSIDEWDTIRQYSPKAFFSWIGLVRFAQYEKTEELPRWQTEGALDPSKINWLIRPYKPLPNGWSTISNCAVHYNPPLALDSVSYVFFYPCTSAMHSICERNATIINHSNTFY